MFCSGYGEFRPSVCQRYSDLTAPLVEPTPKSLVKRTSFKKAWGPAQDAAFQKLKDDLFRGPCSPLSRFLERFFRSHQRFQARRRCFPSPAVQGQHRWQGAGYCRVLYSKRFSRNQSHYSLR